MLVGIKDTSKDEFIGIKLYLKDPSLLTVIRWLMKWADNIFACCGRAGLFPWINFFCRDGSYEVSDTRIRPKLWSKSGDIWAEKVLYVAINFSRTHSPSWGLLPSDKFNFPYTKINREISFYDSSYFSIFLKNQLFLHITHGIFTV